jgi:hypothetical protein
LWIDQLGQRHERPTDADFVWMQDFPPPINTVWFVRRISGWADLLLRSGHSQAATVLTRRLNQEFAHVAGISGVARDVELYYAGLPGRTTYFLHQMARKARDSLRSVKRKLRAVG